jgi:hypothetical protein
LSGKTLKDLTSEILLSHSSDEAKKISTLKSHRVVIEPIDHTSIETECHTERETIVCEPKKRRLRDNQGAPAKIKELWDSGNHNQAEIARAVGYPKATVAENIRTMRKEGKIV